jgi:glutathione S-transferase
VGVPFEEVVIRLDRPETAASIHRHSPSGRVPALRHGELLIWESLAICEYLAERFPAAGLWPEEISARAVARAVSAEMHAGFAALRAAMTMNIRGSGLPAERTSAVEQDIARIIAIWEECRGRWGGGGPFLFGRFGIADAMFAPVVTRFKTYGVGTTGAAAAYVDRVWSSPAMLEWRAAAAAEPWSIEKYEPQVTASGRG